MITVEGSRFRIFGISLLFLVALGCSTAPVRIGHTTFGELAASFGQPQHVAGHKEGTKAVWILEQNASGSAKDVFSSRVIAQFDHDGVLRDWKQEHGRFGLIQSPLEGNTRWDGSFPRVDLPRPDPDPFFW